jgi:hypothetical protein
VTWKNGPFPAPRGKRLPQLHENAQMSTSCEPPTRRRWFEFGIGTMLVLVAAFAIPLGELSHVRKRKAFIAAVDASHEYWSVERATKFEEWAAQTGSRYYPPVIPWPRRWLGDEPIERIIIIDSPPTIKQEAMALFPEAVVIDMLSPSGSRELQHPARDRWGDGRQ